MFWRCEFYNLHFACVKDILIVDSETVVWMKETDKNKLTQGWETKVSTKFPISKRQHLQNQKTHLKQLPHHLVKTSYEIFLAPPILRVEGNEAAAVYEQDYFAFLPIGLHFLLAK